MRVMKKIIEIKGMHCDRCRANAEKALNAVEGVSAKVNLAKKNAVVTLKGEVSDETLRNAITALGFEVCSITEKKGIFG